MICIKVFDINKINGIAYAGEQAAPAWLFLRAGIEHIKRLLCFMTFVTGTVLLAFSYCHAETY